MTDLIERIANAIFRQEGMPADYANPGNLRGCAWLPSSAQRGPMIISGGFWRPPSRNAGVAGAVHLVALRVAEGYSLTELITSWAPPTDGNDTAAYIANVKAWASIPDETVPLWNFIDSV